MISTKNIITSLKDIDIPWVYRHFLNLPQPLTGANIKIKSPLKVGEDWDPSFLLYKKAGQEYQWNCLSTGTMGDVIELVRLLKTSDAKRELTRPEAFRIIKDAFIGQLKGENVDYVKIPQLVNTPGKVIGSEMRRWQDSDIEFWSQFGISIELLESYNISPLSNFTMEKTTDGVRKEMTIRNPKSYGYYTGQGDLAKIYQPGLKGAKFIKVLDYTQASNQLKFNVPNLLIISSMKDGLAFMALGIEGYEFVAPDSENVCLKKTEIDFYKTKYENIQVLFDIDEPGIAAAFKYKEKFGFESIYLDLEKDVAESVEIYGQELVKIKLLQLL